MTQWQQPVSPLPTPKGYRARFRALGLAGKVQRVIGIAVMIGGLTIGLILVIVGAASADRRGAIGVGLGVGAGGLLYGFFFLVGGQVIELALTIGEDVHNMLDRL